ncbi:MAG: hypothetical protein E6I35_11685 [Chloroflexi bacterium]|nr:MAG: hypothetical protein E6I35_11685 [Chloroflexota bacterium]
MTEQTTNLFGPVAGDLATVESELRQQIQRDPPEVARPMADLFEAGGKRIRPALVLLSAMSGRYDLARLASISPRLMSWPQSPPNRRSWRSSRGP